MGLPVRVIVVVISLLGSPPARGRVRARSAWTTDLGRNLAVDLSGPRLGLPPPDHQAQAGVELVEVVQVAVSLRPRPRRQVRLETAEPPLDR